MLSKRLLPSVSLFFILLMTVLAYLPGLHGGFLFDDLSNLGEMNKYGDMHQWENAQKFVMNGIGGPTGRPIALLTFVPQADSWLTQNAFLFKVVNLIIHLLCGVLLYWVTRLLLRAYGEIKEEKIAWIALLTASFWLLHPLMLSTTLYVIQRMAQLPLLFSLLAMIGYFKGRALLNIKPQFAYALMTVSIALGTVLATLSKENGALLPLLMLVIEFCNPNQNNKPVWQWRAVCLWLPSVAIAVMLMRFIDFSADPWPNRNFNQIERLLTEGRVVTDYLAQLFIPRIEGNGFFQDGTLISKGWLSPPSTLFSILFLLALFIGSLLVRKKYPLISLGILFFFAAHLMESTVVGLELSFEHRNYVAAIFLFLPLAAGLSTLSEHIKPNIPIFVSILILAVLAAMTWQRAVLWSNTDKLMLYWAQNSPNSPRAQSAIATVLAQGGHFKEADQVVELALQKHPESGLLGLQLLLQKIEAGSINQQDFVQATKRISSQRADIQAAIALRDLVFYTLDQPQIIAQHGDALLGLLDAILHNPTYLRIKDVQNYVIFLQGRILTLQKKPDLAYQHFSQSLALSHDVGSGLDMVILLGNAGYLPQALKLLDETKVVFEHQPLDTLQRSHAYYQKTIQQTRQDMQKDLQAEQMKRAHKQ
jgi:tetratricopeptide (TPR) repeat protein